MSLVVFCLALLSLPFKVSSYYCDGGHYCATAKECCEDGCCYTYPLQRPSPPAHPPYRSINIFVYNHWYFWCVVCALSALVGCAWWAWRRRSRLCGSCCRTLARRSRASDRDSAGSCYMPPHYSRCSSFQRAPPPYNEVTSKPDLYPLVITYGDSGGKGGGGNYLMVHYLRNYIIRPPGSVSATSTTDSLNSSFICNATNEANSIIPPPYSCAGNFDEWRGGCGGEGGGARPAMLRSLSTMTCVASRNNHQPPLRIDDAPDINTVVVTAAFPELNRLDSSPEPIDNRIFRQSLLRTASRLAIHHDLEDFPRGRYAMPDYDIENEYDTRESPDDNPQRPRLGLSPEPTERSPSPTQASDPEIESWRHLYESLPRAERTCESPPRPTSPTMDTVHRAPDAKQKRAAAKNRQTSLYMPLSTQGARYSRMSPGTENQGRSFTQRAFSISAPTTPCGTGLVPTLLTLSQRMSGSVFSSRSSRLAREESDPLLEGEERSGLEPDAHARTDGPF